MQDLRPEICKSVVACAWFDKLYLACLLLQWKQLIDGSLWVALEPCVSFVQLLNVPDAPIRASRPPESGYRPPC